MGGPIPSRSNTRAETSERIARFRAAGGLNLAVKDAARRFGVDTRTITRWRRLLRDEEAAGD